MTQPSTLDAGLRQSVAHRPDQTAIEADGVTLTYGALDAAIEAAVPWLSERGVRPGDRVLLQIDKGLAFLLLHLANMRLGSVTVPINPGATADELAYTAHDSRPALIVREATLPALAEPQRKSTAGAAVATLARDELPSGTSVARYPAPEPDDLACLLYTSGTTGRPKGARLLQRQLAANIATLADAWSWTSDDRLLHALPLFHVHGLFVAASVALHRGASIELMPRFDTEPVWSALLSGRVTLFMGVPTMYHRLLATAPEQPTRPLPVRLFTSGSAPLRIETLSAWEQLTGHVILERYGMTEVGMAASNPLLGPRKPGSVGPALPGVGLRVVETSTGTALPTGHVGEVQISGPSVFDGYWAQPERTAETFTNDGWLRSGDLGRIDTDGYLQLVGRTKELIITGGMNVSPLEVEKVLDQHPAIAESAVCGVPDADFGEAVVAGIVLHPDGECTAEELIAFARQHLAGYKLPKRVAFLSELPRNAMGKLARNRLAQAGALRGPS